MNVTKEQILEAQDRATIKIEVPEWGGTTKKPAVVTLQEIEAGQRDEWEKLVMENGLTSAPHIRARMVAQCMIDPDTGDRVFDVASVPALSRKGSLVMDRLFGACMDLNGLRKKDLDDLAKNSDGTPES